MKFKLKEINKREIKNSAGTSVFDITVENNHSYCVKGIVVHNCGYPQLSAIIECADAAHGLKGHVMSDGGCRHPSDVCKAFGAGADFVMLGGMLAGHEQSPGRSFVQNGKVYKEFYGMSSHLAQERHSGGVRSYRSSEGREVLLESKGDLNNTILDILGGLRSCCAYVGAHRLKELPKCTTFIKVSRQLNDVYATKPSIDTQN